MEMLMTKVLPRLSLAVTLSLLAGPTLADRIEVTCAGSTPYAGDTTICDTLGSLGFRSDGPEVPFFLTLTAPATHCSDVAYLVYRPGDPNALGFTSRLAPGQTQTVEIGAGFGPGEAQVDIGAIGFVGGCNTGAIGSWAVDASAAPVP
jgi:hypothetical protein